MSHNTALCGDQSKIGCGSDLPPAVHAPLFTNGEIQTFLTILNATQGTQSVLHCHNHNVGACFRFLVKRRCRL